MNNKDKESVITWSLPKQKCSSHRQEPAHWEEMKYDWAIYLANRNRKVSTSSPQTSFHSWRSAILKSHWTNSITYCLQIDILIEWLYKSRVVFTGVHVYSLFTESAKVQAYRDLVSVWSSNITGLCLCTWWSLVGQEWWQKTALVSCEPAGTWAGSPDS